MSSVKPSLPIGVSQALGGFRQRRQTLVVLAVVVCATFSCSRAPIKSDGNASGDIPSTGVAATPVAPVGPPITIAAATANGKSVSARPLTSTGQNSDARFSPDGTRIVFVSRKRPSHKQAQLYELHIGRMTEKRITFHDGDDATPAYAPDGLKIVFASTTDEIKEEPFAIPHARQAYLDTQSESPLAAPTSTPSEGYELYVQTLNARVIERLTKIAGMDSDPDYDKKGRRIAFASARDLEGIHIFILSDERSIQRVSEGKVLDRQPRFSPDDSALIWTRQTASTPESSQLIVATDRFRKQKVLVDGGGLNLHPSWLPTGGLIIFSSNRTGGHFNLFTVNSSGSCMQQLTKADVDQLDPVFSPDGKRILFTSVSEGQRHVFMMDFVPPANCVPAVPDSRPDSRPDSKPESRPEASPAPLSRTPQPTPP